jgi:uncharacterized membrane protein
VIQRGLLKDKEIVLMKRFTLFRGSRLSLAALALVTLALSVIALTIGMLVDAVAPSVLEVPSDDPVLSLMSVSLASILSVLGYAIGFYFSYRSHDPRALLKFLAPAAGFFLAFMISPVWGLLAGDAFASFAVASALNVVPLAVALPVLLSLRPDNATDTLEIDAATRAAVIERIDHLGGTESKDHA